jgi:hypothetical protein
MAITTLNPVPDAGGDYDKLGINLAISPLWREDGIGCSVAMRLTPFRVKDGLVEKLDDQARAVVYGDAFAEAQNDPDLAVCVQAIQDALQAFVTAKGV